MATIVAITSCPTGIAHTFMAAEGLEQAAVKLGHTIKVETQGSVGAQNQLNEADVAAADIVVIAADTSVDLTRFAGKRIYETSTKAAINDGAAVIQSALKEAAVPGSKQGGPQRIVAITSCPTGIAHTFMAAEGLQHGATKLGHTIKVETQGSVGAQNALTPDDVAAADIVLIAADTTIDKTRFAGKRIYETSTKAAINDGAAVVQEALAKAAVQSAKAGSDKGLADQALDAKAAQSASRTGVYKHLMTGVSYMIPFVVAGGLLIALGFALGGIYVYDDAHKGTLAANLFWIGKASFQLMVPILAGYAAFSIADRPGIAPGMIAGVIADSIGAGFLGGIVGGFIAGYTVRWLSQTIKLPRTLDGLKPVLILPLLGATITGLLMYYVVGGPVASILATISAWLKSMQGSSAIVLGMLLGSMMAFDMGGPVNKAAYTFGTGLLASQIYEPMAAIMAAGMTPPLGIALATMLFRNRFSADEREAGKAAAALGISFITEGAIPFAAKDPLRVIPSIMIGSAITGAISMAVGAQLHVPHGGIFVLPMPNAVSGLLGYTVAIVVGTVVTAFALFLLKKPLENSAA
ncbi:PTS fructose-like transporter subunit IIB [Propionivibrio sp.]|uniref:PTS fructose-like transporter subunit IIB n=1 Tax=Propionivibrio sp. TaxID=2212460 RepID=UPI00272EAC29|nr:PTS fructose-like transporter subunit IIB [Propionivibrio sp.]